MYNSITMGKVALAESLSAGCNFLVISHDRSTYPIDR